MNFPSIPGSVNGPQGGRIWPLLLHWLAGLLPLRLPLSPVNQSSSRRLDSAIAHASVQTPRSLDPTIKPSIQPSRPTARAVLAPGLRDRTRKGRLCPLKVRAWAPSAPTTFYTAGHDEGEGPRLPFCFSSTVVYHFSRSPFLLSPPRRLFVSSLALPALFGLVLTGPLSSLPLRQFSLDSLLLPVRLCSSALPSHILRILGDIPEKLCILAAHSGIPASARVV